MAYSLAKPQRAADRASPDIHVPLPLEGPGKGCCHRGRSPLRTTDRKLPGPGPRPGNVGVEGRGFRSAYRSEDTTVAPPPQRTPGRKPGSGALIEPTIGLRGANRAKHQVPVALSKPSTAFPEQQPGRVPNSQSISRAEQRVPAAKNRQLCPAAVKIDDSSQPQGQNARLFAPAMTNASQ